MNAADASVKIAQKSAEAAAGYATAAFAAYADMASQTMNFWAQTFDAMVPRPEPEPRSWYRPPADLARSAAPARNTATASFFPLWQMVGVPAPARRASTPALFGWTAPRSPLDFWQSWLSMWPLQGPPACWPMAFAMMGAGWSRDVAYPAAQANAAAMDAISTAADAMRTPFSSYRSESGYASAQIVMAGSKVAGAAALPLAMFAPWLQAFAASPTRL